MMKKAQAILEFTLAFIVMVALIAGLLKLWSWSNSQMKSRQDVYEDTRVQAGSKETPGEPAIVYSDEEKKDADIYLFK